MYSKQVAQHIAQPRNAGDLTDASGVAEVTNEVCMDRIRLAIRVENHVIADARFKAQGCPPTLAAASSLTELIIGLSVAAAEQIGRQDIVRSLGRLPAAKSHCAALAVDALRAAIEDFRSRG